MCLFFIWFFTWLAVFLLPSQRAASLEFLAAARGRRARLRDVAHHFEMLGQMLLVRMGIANGRKPRIVAEFDHKEEILDFIRSDRPGLFGTFHVGHSDLVGFYLADLGRKIRMIRLRVGNSADMDRLSELYRDSVDLLWINEPGSLFFALKDSAADGVSLAMQCDRTEYASKVEAFEFFGARRLFPFTIYHLSWIFEMPVMFSVALAGESGESRLMVWRPFEGDRSAGRAGYLQQAREHFQAVLCDLEALLRESPFQWFNFIPLNPVVE